MKAMLCVGFILLILIGVPLATSHVNIVAQESKQFKIENTTILQDSSEPSEEGDSPAIDLRRDSRLNKEGFSALIGETPLRISLEKTNLDYSSSQEGIGLENDTRVKIMYTIEGGYALYLGARPGVYTASVFSSTGCGNDMNKCFSASAKPWIDSDVYGFGYTVQGPGAAPDFVNQTYFRPFSAITTQDPSGTLAAEGQAKDETIELKTRLNRARPEQGTFSQNIVITVLHDW